MLHGKIAVNGEEIGRWRAINTLQTVDGETRYECEVVQGTDFSLNSRRRTFDVWHKRSEGAFALAAKALTEGARLLAEPKWKVDE